MALKIFISYATVDKEMYQIPMISEILKEKPEISDVWYWEESAYGKIYKFMNDKIEQCDVLLLFCSENSVTSEFVEDEWIAARSQGKIVIPIFKSISNVPVILRGIRGLEIDLNNLDDFQEQMYSLIIKSVEEWENKQKQKYNTLKNNAQRLIEENKWSEVESNYEAILKLCQRYKWTEKYNQSFKELNTSIISREIETLKKSLVNLDDNIVKNLNNLNSPLLLEETSLSEERTAQLNKLREDLEASKSIQLFPISGTKGIGKTFFVKKLKNDPIVENRFILIDIIKLLNEPKRFYYNFYKQILDEISFETLDTIFKELTIEWGASNLAFGFFRTTKISEVIENAQSMLFASSDDQVAMGDIINAIVCYKLDKYREEDAKKYLCGADLDINDLSRLNVLYNLLNPKHALEMLKLVLSSPILNPILIIDDVDKWGSFNNFLELLNPLLRNNHNLKIVITFNQNNEDGILEELTKTFKNKTNNVVKITEFSSENVMTFFIELIQLHNKKHSLSFSEKNLYYPFTKKIIQSIYNLSDGNPKKIINKLQDILIKVK